MFQYHQLHKTSFRTPTQKEKEMKVFTCELYGLQNPETMTEEEALKYLARILIDWYIKSNGK